MASGRVLWRSLLPPAYRVIIGLNGGIAAGKSHIRSVLAAAGAQTIDADTVAHELYAPGNACYDALVAKFGGGIVGVGGVINRKALGSIVFSDESQRAVLNSIVWPATEAAVLSKLAIAARSITDMSPDGKPPALVGVVEAALLVEGEWYKSVDEVWTAYVSDDEAVERVMVRNGLPQDEARKRVRAQPPLKDRLEHATVTIDTSGSMDATRSIVMHEWRGLRERWSLP